MIYKFTTYMQSNDNQVNNILWSNNLVEIYIVKIFIILEY